MYNQEYNEELRILVIEDYLAYIRIMQEVSKGSKLNTTLYIFEIELEPQKISRNSKNFGAQKSLIFEGFQTRSFWAYNL